MEGTSFSVCFVRKGCHLVRLSRGSLVVVLIAARIDDGADRKHCKTYCLRTLSAQGSAIRTYAHRLIAATKLASQAMSHFHKEVLFISRGASIWL